MLQLQVPYMILSIYHTLGIIFIGLPIISVRKNIIEIEVCLSNAFYPMPTHYWLSCQIPHLILLYSAVILCKYLKL